METKRNEGGSFSDKNIVLRLKTRFPDMFNNLLMYVFTA